MSQPVALPFSTTPQISLQNVAALFIPADCFQAAVRIELKLMLLAFCFLSSFWTWKQSWASFLKYQNNQHSVTTGQIDITAIVTGNLAQRIDESDDKNLTILGISLLAAVAWPHGLSMSIQVSYPESWKGWGQTPMDLCRWPNSNLEDKDSSIRRHVSS